MSVSPPAAKLPRIRQLDADLAAKVAAGEVIERPSSVVKELIENCIDASATRISVELEEAGRTLIRVTDNGHGIPAQDLASAIMSHSTSKIATLDDLFAIRTLGFRGEALPSIASVSDLELASCDNDDSLGAAVRASGPLISSVMPRGLPRGTVATVRNLFATVPARLKHLKSRAAETSAIQNVIHHYALAYPATIISFYADGVHLFTSPGTGACTDVLTTLYGSEVGSKLMQVNGSRRGVQVSGLISRPDLSRPSRSYQSFFVNGRWVQNRLLSIALEEAYRTHLMVGRHPLGVLYITVPPDHVDVNCHPAKSDIRFLYEREIFSAIRDAALAAVMQTMNQPGRNLTLGDNGPDEPIELQQERLSGDFVSDYASAASYTGTAFNSTHASVNHLPLLRVLGQSNNLFVIAEGPDGVYMIDQHAAHERILFDRLQLQVQEKQVTQQYLLEPIAVELTPVQFAALEGHEQDLVELGFDVDIFGASACLIRAVPMLLELKNPIDVLQELLDGQSLVEDAAERLDARLAMIACKSAVKAGESLSLEEMRRLIYELEHTSRPRTCPHGRPTMIMLATGQLEKEFGRKGA